MIIGIDAGEKIDKFAMVVMREHYKDFKAAVPQHFDKLEVVNYEA
jgi:hypothetical protein